MIAIGVGANSHAHREDFAAAISEAARQAGDAKAVATFEAAIFADHVRSAARQLGLGYRPVTLDAMRERSNECLTLSEWTLSLFGVASIAEAAALAGAGPGSHLILRRRIVGAITIAAAQSAGERGRQE